MVPGKHARILRSRKVVFFAPLPRREAFGLFGNAPSGHGLIPLLQIDAQESDAGISSRTFSVGLQQSQVRPRGKRFLPPVLLPWKKATGQ